MSYVFAEMFLNLHGHSKIMGDLRLEIRRGHVVRDMTEGTFIHIKVGPLPSLSLRGGINVGV